MSRKPSNPKVKRGPAPEPAEADRLDAAVYQILQKLKAGKAVRLPGLGILRPGPEKSVFLDELTGNPTGNAKANANAKAKAMAKEGADASKKQRRP